MSTVEELSKGILSKLLADFAERKLTAKDLSNTYVGLIIAALKQGCCEVTLLTSA
jgi:hypothetical protein